METNGVLQAHPQTLFSNFTRTLVAGSKYTRLGWVTPGSLWAFVVALAVRWFPQLFRLSAAFQASSKEVSIPLPSTLSPASCVLP